MSYRLPYLVGNTKDRDYNYQTTMIKSEVQSLIADFSLPSNFIDYWPQGLLEAQIQALVWRVKTWQFSGSASVSWHESFAPFSAYTDTWTYSNTVTTDLLATSKETSLVGGCSFDQFYPPSFIDCINPFFFLGTNSMPTASSCVYSGTFGGGGGFGSSDIRFLQAIGDGSGSVPYPFIIFDPATKLFYPQIFMSLAGLGDGPMDVNADSYLAAHVANGSFDVSPGIIPNFTIPIYTSAVSLNIQSILDSYSVAGTLTATEFWPYADNNGDPIYDAATGAQLRDPFG